MPSPRLSASPVSANALPSWALLAMVLTLGWSLLALSIHREYREVQEQARQSLEHQIKFAEASLGRQLQITSHVLDTVRKAPWLKNPRAVPQAEATADLKNLAALMTGVRSLLVINIDGAVVASNRVELLGQNMYQSERYQTISGDPHPDTLYLSPPFLTPLKNWAMAASKMLVKGNNEFNGYVLAILDPSYFQTMMQSIRYTEDTRATLIHSSGKVVMRMPDVESLAGQDLSARPGNLFTQFQQTGKDRAIVEGTSSVSGESLLVMFTTIRPEFSTSKQSLVFGVSREYKQILQPWRNHTLERLAMAVVLTAVAMLALRCWLQRRQASRLGTAAQ